MDLKEQIYRFLEDYLEGSSYFVVEVEKKGTERFPKLFLYIDGDEGISIEKCSEISRKVGKYIEENQLITTEYGLDVSSPGLDRPLKYLRQYKKNIGKKVRVKTETEMKKPLEGILKAVSEEDIELEVKKGKKEVQSEKISFDNIIEMKVLVTF